MAYLVIEIWEPTDGATPQTITYPKETKDEAFSTFHYILYQAAVSSHYRHGAVLMEPDGKYLGRESYVHLPTPVTEQTNE